MTDSSRDLLLDIRDGVASITVNRPDARNSMTSAMFEEMTEMLCRFENDLSVRVVLLQGAGKSFVAGGDVKAFAAGLALSPAERADDMATRAGRAGRLCAVIARIPQPVIVAATGYSVGAGLSIVTAADLVIASQSAQFSLAHIGLGISPDGAITFFLPRQIGMKRAKQLALLGDVISAQQALAMGLVNWVVDDAEIDHQARELANRLVGIPVTAAAEIKALFAQSFGRSLNEQIAAENASIKRCAFTPDFAEGLLAMREKRKPRFRRTQSDADTSIDPL